VGHDQRSPKHQINVHTDKANAGIGFQKVGNFFAVDCKRDQHFQNILLGPTAIHSTRYQRHYSVTIP